MNDKKIFIALSQREARSILTAIQFTTTGCSKMNGEDVLFNPENAEVIGITSEDLIGLWEFSDRLKNLADEQAELEANINAAEPETLNPISIGSEP